MRVKLLIIIHILLTIISTSLAKEEKELDYIDLEIVQIEDSVLYAKITNITEEAKEFDIHNIMLRGQYEMEQSYASQKLVKIHWDSLKYNEVLEEIGEYFYSEIKVIGDIAIGDEFTARGDLDLLASKLDDIKNNSNEEEKLYSDNNYLEQRADDEPAPISSNSSSGSLIGGGSSITPTPQDKEDLPELGLQFDPEKEIETEEGCSKRVDLVKMKVYVQKRVVKAGAEVSPCKDTTTSYALTKEYKSCPNFVDLKAQKFYQQYRITYKPSGSDRIVEVQGCIQDKDKYTILNKDYDSCGISHNTSQKISYRKYRLVYDNKIYQDCVVDNSQKLPHFEDTSGCTNKQVGSDIIEYYKVAYKIGNKTHYIGDCIPSTQKYKIYDEICSTNKYEHDLASAQTYLNKNYYYFKGGKRIDLSSCIRSKEALDHFYDLSECINKNDDSTKKTQLYAKTYIKDSSLGSGVVYIGGCKKYGLPVNYTLLGDIWQVTESSQNVSVVAPQLNTKEIHLGTNLPSDYRSRCYDSYQVSITMTDWRQLL